MDIKPFKIDIPVLLIFFARPKQTALVFEQIRIARPSRLWFYQDGPRQGRADDIENIEKCRMIVRNIDWDCQVYELFQEVNYGCDPSGYIAHSWMLRNEEYGIILEDDVVPSQSFFPFCKELLEKYKNDERINMICGMNNLEKVTDYPESYLFTTSGSIWGWATWKRVAEQWEAEYNYLNDPFTLSLLKRKIGRKYYRVLIKVWADHKNSGKPHFESILGSSLYLNSRLNIVPTMNMISNTGLSENSTHAADSLKKIPKRLRQLFFMKTYELDFPLKHPKYIVEDIEYKRNVDKLMANGYPLIKLYRLIESIFLRLIYGDIKSLLAGFKRRLKGQNYKPGI